MTSKQISILLPLELIKAASNKAEVQNRPDGLKLTTTAVLRNWLIAGAQLEESISGQKDNTAISAR